MDCTPHISDVAMVSQQDTDNAAELNKVCLFRPSVFRWTKGGVHAHPRYRLACLRSIMQTYPRAFFAAPALFLLLLLLLY